MKVFLPIHFLLGLIGYFMLSGSTTEKLMLFGCVVVIPLMLYIVEDKFAKGFYHSFYFKLMGFMPVATFSAFLSFFTHMETAARITSLIWAVYLVWLALYGILRIGIRGILPLNELFLNMGLIYLSIGGFWFVAYHWEWEIMNLSSQMTLLTAIHFHYSAPVLCIFVGFLGRVLDNSRKGIRIFYNVVGGAMIISPILIAAGITFSRTFEFASVVVLAASFFIYLLMVFFHVFPRTGSWESKTLLFISHMSAVVTIAFACLYAYGRSQELDLVPIETMLKYHGQINAFAFVFLGLIGWKMTKAESLYDPSVIPFGKIQGKGKIGADFLERNGYVKDTSEKSKGLVENMKVFQRDEDFQLSRIHPSIRDFYEDTLSYDMEVTPEWKKGWKWSGRLFKKVTAHIGQLNLPMDADKEKKVFSRIIPVSDELDGRPLVRAWVREYPETKETMFVALYSFHTYFKETFMNISLPVPFGTVTGILRLEEMDTPSGKKGLRLLTKRDSLPYGDEGVYFKTKHFAIRLPLNELFQIEALNKKELKATHVLFFFGIPVLSLRYVLKKNR